MRLFSRKMNRIDAKLIKNDQAYRIKSVMSATLAVALALVVLNNFIIL